MLPGNPSILLKIYLLKVLAMRNCVYLIKGCKIAVRVTCANQLSENIVRNRNLTPSTRYEIARGVRNKDCFYVITDGDNKF